MDTSVIKYKVFLFSDFFVCCVATIGSFWAGGIALAGVDVSDSLIW